MPSFFSDDDRCGNDLNDMMNQAPGAIKQGLILGYICSLPFMLLEKIVGGIADASAAKARAQQQNINEPPPKIEPPPWARQQQYAPPPPPPPQPDPLEKYRLILGVSKTANKEELKKRYRFKSHCCHPDKVAEHMREEAEEEFKCISEAYRILEAVAPEGPAKPKPQGKQACTTPPPPPRHPQPKQERPPTPAAPAAKQEANKPPHVAAVENLTKEEIFDRLYKNTGTKGIKPKYF